MKYHQLKTTKPKEAKRVGRGIAAGQGKTAGRGTKGQGARAGYSKKPGFAGGSNPLMQKLPKLAGFRSHKPKNEIIYTDQLSKLAAKTIDTTALAQAGLISNPYAKVKLLVRGEVKQKLSLKLTGASKSAITLIEAAGGNFEKVNRTQRPITSSKPKTNKDN